MLLVLVTAIVGALRWPWWVPAIPAVLAVALRSTFDPSRPEMIFVAGGTFLILSYVGYGIGLLVNRLTRSFARGARPEEAAKEKTDAIASAREARGRAIKGS